MSKTLQGKYADKLNKQIEELYKVIDAKDKIINEQVLKIEDLQQRIDKAITYINSLFNTIDYDDEEFITFENLDNILEILGDKK